MYERKQRKAAFTLIEIMIALAIMSVLLTIILIPLRLGFDSLHVGQARSNNQIAVQATLSDIETDLRQAAYVFPNTTMPGITDQVPFTTSANVGTAVPPYTRSTSATDTAVPANGGCKVGSGAERWSNPARIDMIPARRDTAGNIVLPVEPDDKIVTYYPGRLNPTAAYDPIDNPMVLYRAEYEYQRTVGTTTTKFIDLDAPRFTTSGCDANYYKWLAHNVYGEPVIQKLDNKNSLVEEFSKTLATPRGLSIVSSRAFRIGNNFQPPTNAATINNEAPLKPDSSFTCFDTNNDGKIDRVNISLAIVSYDTSSNGSLRNGQPSGQALRAERTVVLPNIQ